MGVEFKDLVHDGGRIGTAAAAIVSECGDMPLREGQALDMAFEMYRMSKMADAEAAQEAFVSLRQMILATLEKLEAAMLEDDEYEDDDDDEVMIDGDNTEVKGE